MKKGPNTDHSVFHHKLENTTSIIEREKLPLDARLLNDAIIELNISRRNVSIYPKDHPLLEKSLSRAFDFLKIIFVAPENYIMIGLEKAEVAVSVEGILKTFPEKKTLLKGDDKWRDYINSSILSYVMNKNDEKYI